MSLVKTLEYGKSNGSMFGYIYGMRLRGYSPGAQPDGVTWFDDNTDRYGHTENGRRYHSVIAYDRQLTEKEMRDYDLDFLEKDLPSDWVI